MPSVTKYLYFHPKLQEHGPACAPEAADTPGQKPATRAGGTSLGMVPQPGGTPKPNHFMLPQHEGPAELLQNHLHFSTHHILYLLWGKKRASDIRKVTENKAAAWFARLDGTKRNTWCCGVSSEHWARLIKTKKKKRNKPPNNWIFSNQTDNIYSLPVVPKYFRKFLSLSE